MSRDARWFQSEPTDLDLLRRGSRQSRRVQACLYLPGFLAEQVCLQVVKWFPWLESRQIEPLQVANHTCSIQFNEVEGRERFG